MCSACEFVLVLQSSLTMKMALERLKWFLSLFGFIVASQTFCCCIKETLDTLRVARMINSYLFVLALTVNAKPSGKSVQLWCNVVRSLSTPIECTSTYNM